MSLSEKYKQTAKRMIIFESVFAIIIIFAFLWLINILVGLYFILFITMVVAWAIGLVFSIIVFKKSKKQIFQERIDAVEVGGSDAPLKRPFRLEDEEEEL